MKRLTLSLATVLVAALAAAAPASAGRSAEAILADAEALLAGNGDASAAASGGGREATLVLRDLALRISELGAPDRRRAREILARPDQGSDPDHFGAEDPASPHCDANFCVHWGVSPTHAPDPTDAPPNGIPDYIEEVLAAAQASFTAENGILGWRKAKPDGARGSRGAVGAAGQVDVYIAELGSELFGYAAPDPGQGGRSRSAYLVIDNDYAGFGGPPLDFMRVTVAHEYNHILQFAYDTFADTWLFEATATWVEDHVYPTINDYLNFVAKFAEMPHIPLAEKDSRARKLYGSSMWNHWLTANRGAGTVRAAWSDSPLATPPSFALSAFDNAIKAAGGRSFSADFARFAAATAEWNSSPAFPDAGLYPEMRRSGKLGRRAKRAKLDHTAYRLYNVRARGRVKLVGKFERGVRSAIALVGRAGPAAGGVVTTQLRYLPNGGRARVVLPNTGGLTRVTAVLINADGRVRGFSRRYKHDRVRFNAKLGR